MFLYLIYNSNIIGDDENKLIKIVIYSIVLYIVLHLIINSILYSLPFLGYYFWIIFILDCLSLGSVLVRETNGDILVNNININTKQKKEPKIDEIERATHNLEELIKETNEIKNMVKTETHIQPKLDIENSKEFDRFIEELTNSDIEQKLKQNSIHGFNSSSVEEITTNVKSIDSREPPKDEREKIMESLQNKINNKPNDDVTNIDSDIDIDISDFDKLIE